MHKDKRPDAPPHRGLASPEEVEAGAAPAARPETTDLSAERDGQGEPRAPGQGLGAEAEGDYSKLPEDLDGMHNDSPEPGVQAAGSREEAADAARRAAREAGGRASELFAGSPGEEGPAPNIPSTLNMDDRPSAARTGRDERRDWERKHNAASAAVTGGDVDADWESAYSTGDEAPGGDNPTPDQDIVDEIGKALGLEYQDAEELKGAEKVEERDRRRWELDPASSEDYAERNKHDGKV